MVRYWIKTWREQLFYLEKSNFLPCDANISVTYVPINRENSRLVCNLRGEAYYKQFQKQLSAGDFGLYAMYEEKPIAYGWVKHGGSGDYFFKIGKKTCYLCRFYTDEAYRGNRIYPSLITKLIQKEDWCDHFYIDIEKGNNSSQKGLEKVGFRFLREYRFLRFFKLTLKKGRIE